jgi:HK97 family phage portal protein
MGFWATFFDRMSNVPAVPNDNGPEDLNYGDPDGFEILGDPIEQRALPQLYPSGWDGLPSGWQMDWDTRVGLNQLVDIAWACVDKNSKIVSAMPVYRLRDGQVIEQKTWMTNPDPTTYTCWGEFCRQLYWDYLLGEVFVMPTAVGFDGYPIGFRVIPPWAVDVEMRNGSREYKIGTINVTNEILHIRYHSTTTEPRGSGPLEVAGARLTNIGLLQRYVGELAKTGGVPLYWMELERRITASEGTDIMERWKETRTQNAGHPALVSGGAKLNQARTMDAKEMGLLELSQFDESRIAILLGVPPFLVGLAGASGSLTYSNVSDLYDFHDRSHLRPDVRMLMESLSAWALPRGQSVELNRDDYTRLPLDKRAQVYKTLMELGIIDANYVQSVERFHGEPAAEALTGGAD